MKFGNLNEVFENEKTIYEKIDDINKEHIEKLKGRGWETEADINVEVERKE